MPARFGGRSRSVAEPRNARALLLLELGDVFIVSFVGSTAFEGSHVFVDPGVRYDWRCAAGLQACIVCRYGQDIAGTVADLLRSTVPYPTIVGIDRQVVGSVVGPARVQPWPIGGEVWRTVFGSE